MILNLMGLEIAEKGKCYRSGDREDNVFTIPIYLFETEPAVPDASFTRVLRVLVCDPAGKYPWEPDCAPVYAEQLTDSEKREMMQICRQRYGTPWN